MPLRPSSRPVRGALPLAGCVAVLAVGCGGRTTGSAGGAGALTGSNAVSASGAATGSTVAGLTSGTIAVSWSSGAGAGGSQQREHPWGSAAPGTANQYAIYGCYYPSASRCQGGAANIAPVGTATLGAGLWGQLDLVGDVWEWEMDWSANYAACTDCADFTSASNRVIRGGDFSFVESTLFPTGRSSSPPAPGGGIIGFRCARAP